MLFVRRSTGSVGALLSVRLTCSVADRGSDSLLPSWEGERDADAFGHRTNLVVRAGHRSLIDALRCEPTEPLVGLIGEQL
jgi:hypothetical protein